MKNLCSRPNHGCSECKGFCGVGTRVAKHGLDANVLQSSQIAESHGSPPKPFDILPSGLIPPPLPKRPAGGPLRASAPQKTSRMVRSLGELTSGTARIGGTKLLWHADG